MIPKYFPFQGKMLSQGMAISLSPTAQTWEICFCVQSPLQYPSLAAYTCVCVYTKAQGASSKCRHFQDREETLIRVWMLLCSGEKVMFWSEHEGKSSPSM